MQELFAFLERINAITLSAPVLVAILGAGLLFTLWSGFSQYRSLTHGLKLVAGEGIDTSQGPGALTHFQALSTALSGTIGLGNIAGVAIAIELGGPGAVFWMWVVGFVGMALKSTEVTLSLMYRDVSDPANPHGGMMYACRTGLATLGPGWGALGRLAGAFFAVCLLIFAITGGNMFQAWNVADTTQAYFGIAPWKTGLVLAVMVGLVLLGGIRRLGSTADKLVPFMCAIYVMVGLYVLAFEAERLPAAIALIFQCAFSPADASGAFTGAAVGSAFVYGMRRALFSSESGLGTAPVAHSAVKTPEPVTEGVVAGLEPFIDTIVVCTITALVVLVSGVWNRAPIGNWVAPPAIVAADANHWKPSTTELPTQGVTGPFRPGQEVFAVVEIDGVRHRLGGTVEVMDTPGGGGIGIEWKELESVSTPVLVEPGVFADFRGSTMAALAFDTAHPGLGKWMVTLAVWLFAFATIIAYGYYGEQAVTYFGGGTRSVVVYRLGWCAVVALTCLGFIHTSVELDTLSTVAMGFMYAINIPLMLLLAPRVMRAWHDYFRRVKSGELT